MLRFLHQMLMYPFDEKTDTYTMSAYLIAQLGKNYAGGRDKEISGKALIELAWMMIEKAQYMFGGMVTFLEAENEEKLLSFYRDNRFRSLIPGRPHQIRRSRMSCYSF